MIDTVRCGLSDVELEAGRLLAKGWTKVDYVEGVGETRRERTQYVLQRKRASPHYLAYSPTNGRLKCELSFPKLLYQNNVEMVKPQDVERGLDRLSEQVSHFCGREVDMAEAEIQGRADFVYSFDARWAGRSHVQEYLDAFSALEMPHHYSQNVARDATLYWRNGQRVIRMYDKEKESGLKAAAGQLRFEVQENHTKAAMDRLFGENSVQVKDVINWETARGVLSWYLDQMGGGSCGL